MNNYPSQRAMLLAQDDTEISAVVRVLDVVYRTPRYRPLDRSLEDQGQTRDDVERFFPTPFANKFAAWLDARVEFSQAMAAFGAVQDAQAAPGAGPAAASARQRAAAGASRRFRESFLEMWAGWRQIVHFVPFVLMAALRRLDDDLLQREVARELDQALHHYKAFYETYDDNRRRESDQRHLLVCLSRVFRKLSANRALDGDFVFASLLDQDGRGFDRLFPERLDAAMLLIQQIRNRIAHGGLENRAPPVLDTILELADRCFLDVCATLAPLCRAFSLDYIVSLRISGARVELATLNFSGGNGPYPCRYRADATPQLDEFRLADSRLYLMRRDRRLIDPRVIDLPVTDSPATASSLTASSLTDSPATDSRRTDWSNADRPGADPPQPMMASRDYLDLTPFLIAESLRSIVRSAQDPLPDAGRLVFALEQYRQSRRELVFLELAGSDQKTLASGRNDLLADLLLQKIDTFVSRARLLTAQVVARDGNLRGTLPMLRSQLWLISREHLASALDIRGWDEFGQPVEDAPDIANRAVYKPRLFVEPAESQRMTAFLAGPQRALMLVGPSGFGKSNLLVHHYLALLRDQRLAVFLAGRQFDGPLLADALVSRLVRQISTDWRTLGDLHDWLDRLGETLVVFVDAVNEYSGHLGAVALLDDLVVTVQREPLLRRLRFVVSCRSETWLRYAQQFGGQRPLDPTVFDTEQGEPLRIAAFQDLPRRRALFDAYQREYHLQPAAYDRLTDITRALFAQPFMMALAAEAYANPLAEPAPATLPTPSLRQTPPLTASSPESLPTPPPTSRPTPPPTPTPTPPRQRELPDELDYFELFDRLTERKKNDAKVLVPASDPVRRSRLPDDIEGFCAALALMLYQRLVSADPESVAAANVTAVPVDEVDKSAQMQQWVRDDGRISVLEVVLQLGLVEMVAIPRRNRLGKLVAGDALAFFHDQYTQFWLAVAYQQEILGWLDEPTLREPAKLDRLVDGFALIVARAVYAPVLSGALDHWLHLNLRVFHDRQPGALIPFFDRLANHESPAVRHQLVSMLSLMILRGVLPARQVFEPVLRDGGTTLRHEMVNVFVEFWPALPPGAARAFIDACDPGRDAQPIDRLADIFAVHVMHDPQRVAAYLIEALSPIGLASVIEPQRVSRQFRFALQFTIFSLLGGFDRPATLAAATEVFRNRYQLVIDVLTGASRGFGPAQIAQRSLRKLLFWLFEKIGVAKFDHFMAAMPGSGNDKFFEANDGVVQRDVLREFLPYAVMIHNGQFDDLSLAQGSRFRELMLRMLDFRTTSIIGYNAVLCLPAVLLRGDWLAGEAFVLELIGRGTPSALFHGNLLLLNLAYSDQALAPRSMALLTDRIVPELLAQQLEFDWSIGFCIAALDVEHLWPACERLLRRLFDFYEPRGEAACTVFGNTLFKIAYCQDPALGQRALAMMLAEPGRFLRAPWRPATLKLCAAMFVRNPVTIRNLLAEAGQDASLLRAAMAYRGDDVIEHSRLFPLQVDSNRFTAWIYIGEPRLRYAVVKYFIGSLATGRSVADFAAGFRQTLIAIIDVYFGREREHLPAGHLSVAEIVAATSRARRAQRAAPEA